MKTLPQETLKTLADDRYVFFLVLSYCKVRKESAVKSSSHFCWNLLLVSSQSSLHHYTASKRLAVLLL